jgi:tetratricopeptide (TPR) repeat protein
MADSPRIEELRRRVQMDPASIAFAALAEEYRRIGRYEAAVATCEAGLQRHPAYLSARVTLGRALFELGRYDEARTHLEQVLRLAPENLAAIRGLAEIHARQRETPRPGRFDVSPEAVAAEVPEDPVPVRVAAPSTAPVRPIQLSTSVAHPDQAALPALEAFLAAIVSAQESRRTDSSAVGLPKEH